MIYQFANNITRFDESSESSQPFVITIIGSNEIAPYLQTLASKKTINKRPLQVKTIHSAGELKDSQLVYLATNAVETIREIVKKTKGSSTLTIGDNPSQLEEGVIITVYFKDTKVKFKVNKRAALAQQFKISPKLLELAETED